MNFEQKTRAGAATSVDPSAAIAAIVAGWADAWNAHDVNAMAELVAPDVDFVTVSGRWLRGAEEFREWHRRIHRLHLRDSRWSNLQYRSRLLTPGLFLVHLDWTIGGEWDPDGKPGPQRSGIFMWLIQRRGDGWFIAAAQNTNLSQGVTHRLSYPASHERLIEGGGT
jgi:uncharacterized protein (TIGR02246 family)